MSWPLKSQEGSSSSLQAAPRLSELKHPDSYIMSANVGPHQSSQPGLPGKCSNRLRNLECGGVHKERRSSPTGSYQLKELGKESIEYICRKGSSSRLRLATMEDVCEIPQSESQGLGTRRVDDVALSLRLRTQENKGLGGTWCKSPSLKIRVLEALMLKDRGLMSISR